MKTENHRVLIIDDERPVLMTVEALLKRKRFYDLTGNGVNHPNDFGHCVYAQSLLALLVEPPK